MRRRSSWLWPAVAFIAALEIAIPLAVRLSRASLAQAAPVAVPASYLMIHASPNSDSEPVSEAPAGTPLPIVGRTPDSAWLLVEIGPGQYGWVITWLCEITGSLESVPVVAGEPAPTAAEMAEAASPAEPDESTGPAEPSEPAPSPEPAATGVPPSPLPTDTTAPTELAPTAAPTEPVAAGEMPAPPTMAPAAITSPSNLPYHATLTGVGYNTRVIFQRGLQLGNNPHAFSKVGDSETADGHFMEPYDLGAYTLGDYAYLGEVVQYFQGSFGRHSMAAYPAFSIHQVLDPEWADAEFCEPGETPLACEYRIHRPSFALILVRTWNVDLYYGDLERIIQYSIDQGVVPILSTCPHQTPPPWASEDVLNPIIRDLAARYQIPLWDIWVTSESLPDRGVCDSCGDHLTMPPPGSPFSASDFVEPSFQYGATRRNLEGLQVLYAMLHEVIQ
jgi:hypothetical protein